MSEKISNADPTGYTLRYAGHFCGCGWCGATVLGYDFPDCCAKMAEWKAGAARALLPEAIDPEPTPEEQRDLAKWARLRSRWASKHGGV